MMYLNPNDVQTALSYIRSSVDTPLALLDLQWNILAVSQPKATDAVHKIVRQCVLSLDPQSVLKTFKASLLTCGGQERPFCQVLFLQQDAISFFPYISTILNMVFEARSEASANKPFDTRTMLVNQLANTGGTNAEINTFMKELGYSNDVSRCAILLFPEFGSNLSGKYDANFIERVYSQDLMISPHYRKQDIYGPFNTDQFLIFKEVDSLQFTQYRQEVEIFCKHLKLMFQDQHGIALNIVVGTPYEQIFSLRQSYKEAIFLQSNYDYLNNRAGVCLFLDQNIYEYLTSLLPEMYLHTRFKHFNQSMEDKPLLMETLMALTKSDTNLVSCTTELGLHRNTVLQRFNKLKNVLDINPLYCDKDRLILRSYALYQNKKIYLHAGIIIQPNSVLHQGMQKMAELIAKNSNGNLVLNIHTLSTSGDNRMLFELLCQGSLDFVVVSSSVMNNATNNRSSILELPFLFESYEEARDLMNNFIIPDLKAPLAAIGARCLGIWTMGWRYITSATEPIRRPSDMKGKKMRIMYNNTMDEYFKSLGIIPIQMNYGDVAKALEAGIIDCQENPYSNILEMKFYKYQKYITRLKYHLSTEGCFISKTTWNNLSEVQQDIVTSAMKETTEWIYPKQQIFNEQCRDILVKEKGMELIDVSAQEELEWREGVKQLYAQSPYQDLLKKITRAKKVYHAKKRSC